MSTLWYLKGADGFLTAAGTDLVWASLVSKIKQPTAENSSTQRPDQENVSNVFQTQKCEIS